MNILHITKYCHIESVGGTERFLLDLLYELDALQHKNILGWLTLKTDQKVLSQGLQVAPLPGTLMRVDPPNPALVPAVKSLIGDFNPDIIHFHTFGRSEAAIARFAREEGIPYVFTYHSPGWTCRREDLMAFNRPTPCDGEACTFRCSACKIHERLRVIPVWLAWLATLASIPFSLFSARKPQSSVRRRTAFLADTFAFRRDLRSFLKVCSVVFSCAEWSIPLLLRNGTEEKVLRYCPQGVSSEMVEICKEADQQRSAKKEFTIGYVGRIVPVKGVDILVGAFRSLHAEDARLRIYGWPEVVPKSAFYDQIKRAADEDARITLVPRLTMTEMMKQYADIDLLCIPSISLETGPLVLFEAFQRGIPVFASDRIGQMQLLQERGEVVEPNTVEGWHLALQQAVEEYRCGEWSHVRARACGTGSLRSMIDVARDVSTGYAEACINTER